MEYWIKRFDRGDYSLLDLLHQAGFKESGINPNGGGLMITIDDVVTFIIEKDYSDEWLKGFLEGVIFQKVRQGGEWICIKENRLLEKFNGLLIIE